MTFFWVIISLAAPFLFTLLALYVDKDVNSQNDKNLENSNQLEGQSVADNNIAECSVGEIQPEIKEAKFVENLAPMITATQSKFKDLNEEHESLLRNETCQSCGTKLYPENEFCHKCGAKVIKEIFCQSCGTKLYPESEFCHKCGAKVIKEIFCQSCGTKLYPENEFCHKCGTKNKLNNSFDTCNNGSQKTTSNDSCETKESHGALRYFWAILACIGGFVGFVFLFAILGIRGIIPYFIMTACLGYVWRAMTKKKVAIDEEDGKKSSGNEKYGLEMKSSDNSEQNLAQGTDSKSTDRSSDFLKMFLGMLVFILGSVISMETRNDVEFCFVGRIISACGGLLVLWSVLGLIAKSKYPPER